MIKVVAFDLMGVVFTEGHMIKNVLMPLLKEHGIKTEKDYVKAQYKLVTKSKIPDNMFWESIDVSDYHDLEKEFLDKFILDPDFKTTVAILSSDYRLGILSNLSIDWGKYLIDKFRFNDYFSLIITSGVERILKPDSKIYEIFREKSGADPDQILFVDDKKENLISANEVGIKTCWYRREEDELDFLSDTEIAKLSQLPNLLNKANEK